MNRKDTSWEQRNNWFTEYYWAHSQGRQRQAEKFSFSLHQQQKDLWYGLTILNKRLSKMYMSNKIRHGWHEKLESGINGRRKKISRGENSERPLPRCAFAIYNSNDVIQVHSRNVSRTTNLLIAKKRLIPYICGPHERAKNEKQSEILI